VDRADVGLLRVQLAPGQHENAMLDAIDVACSPDAFEVDEDFEDGTCRRTAGLVLDLVDGDARGGEACTVRSVSRLVSSFGPAKLRRKRGQGAPPM